MQTYRECEREVRIDMSGDNVLLTCSDPLTYVDYICGMGSTTSLPMKSGASRMLTFGGGHLRLRLNAAVYNDSEMPCGVNAKAVVALVKLPTKEDEITPSYIPNLAISRSQLSVVPATQSDSDENIVWWWDYQLDLTNLTCSSDPGTDNCQQWKGCDVDNHNAAGPYVFGPAAALYGRTEVDVHIKAKRRLREREALYLVQHYITQFTQSDPPLREAWLVRRNVYFRYAVR